jgi:hypothetical protein
MKLRQASAREGMQWMRQGIEHWRRHPLALTSQLGLMVLGLGMLMGLPWIGLVAVLTLLPALSAGWVHTIDHLQKAETGSVRPRVSLRLLLAPLLSPARPRLLMLGTLYAAAILGVLTIVNVLDPSMLDAWELINADPPVAGADRDLHEDALAPAMRTLQQGMLIRVLMLTPVALAFWHAPVIIHRENAGVAKALFGSTLASLRNIGAFGVYALCWGLADAALSLVLGGGLALLGLQNVAVLVALPVGLMFTTAFYASLHATVHGCLVDTESQAEPGLDDPAP